MISNLLGSKSYDLDNPIFEPSRIIIDNEATIAMSKCNKDTAGNRNIARKYHCVFPLIEIITLRSWNVKNYIHIYIYYIISIDYIHTYV